MTTLNSANVAAGGLDPNEDASTIPNDDEVQTVLGRIKAARASVTDPVDMGKYDQAEQEAKQLYTDKANRSEWLGLADRIGNALARVGAANAGLKAGVDTSQINYGPQTDWQTEADRAAKDYTTELGRISGQRSSALRNQQEQFGLADSAFATAAREKAALAADARAEAGRNEASDRQDKSIAAESQRQASSQAFQSGQMDKRQTQQQQFEADREDRLARMGAVKDLDQQTREGQKQLQAKEQLFNDMMTDSSVSSKDKDKLQLQYGKLAGQAGVDLDDIQQKLAAEETRPRLFGGRSSDEDAAAKKAILTGEITKHRNMLDALAARKKALLTRPAPATPGDTGDVDTVPSAPDTVQVQGPSGQVATMQKDAAQKYLSKPGYKLVP